MKQPVDSSVSMTQASGDTFTASDSGKVITVTPVLDTAVYAANELLFNSVELQSAVRENGGTATITSIVIEDKDDQAATAYTLVFANANTNFGTLNAAPSLDDTAGETVLGCVPVAVGDWVDLGGFKVATVRNIGLKVQAAAASTSLWLACVNGAGTPTFTASGWKIKVGLAN